MAQMKAAMFFREVDDNDLHKEFRNVRESLKKANKSGQLIVANNLFGDSSCQFLKDYRRLTRDLYNAQIETADFV